MRNPLLLRLPERLPFLAGFSLRRGTALLGLILILFFFGIYTEQLYHFFDKAFLSLFTSLGISSLLNRSQAEVSTQITMRSWPTIFTYGALYTSLCFLILHVYLNNFRKTKMSAAFYGALFATCILLIFLGKLVPGYTWAYTLCRRFIEMIVSPFPMVFLIAVFHGFSPKNKS